MHRASNYSLSLELMPLVVTTVFEGYGPDDLERMFDDWREVFARKERFVALCDLGRVRAMPDAKQRARTAALTKSIEADSMRYSLGTAMVVSNPIARGAMTAIDWINPPKIPQKYAGTLGEGCDWCIERLRAAELRVTDGIIAYRTRLGGEPVAQRAAQASSSPGAK